MAKTKITIVNVTSDYSGNEITERESGMGRFVLEFKPSASDIPESKYVLTIPDMSMDEFMRAMAEIRGAAITPFMAENELGFREIGKDSGKVASAGSGNSRLMPGATTEAVREWARNNGHDVNDRGRLPGGIIAEFNRAHGYVPAPVESTESKSEEIESEEIESEEIEPTEEEIAATVAEFSAAPKVEEPKTVPAAKPRAPRSGARSGARSGS